MFANVFPKLAAALLAVLLAALASACGTTRIHRQHVLDVGHIQVELRSYSRGGKPVARGFDHPAAIAGVRLAHILSFIDVEVGEGKKRRRIPAVDPVILFEVGDALEVALEEATPDQEVAVLAVRRERRLGIFHADFLTTFIAYVKGDLLTLHFSHTQWEVPKIDQGNRSELPQPREDRKLMDFRIMPDPALTLLGGQTVAVDWRSDLFREPTRVQLSPTGEVRRRTVLMEEAPEASDAPPEGTIRLDDLDPDKLRELADLEEQRRSGAITEEEYQRRRLEVLKR